jgi:hypothetical protein
VPSCQESACRVRAILEAAGRGDECEATLLIDVRLALGGGEPDILLFDVDGEPRFVCDRRSQVLDAAVLQPPALLIIDPASGVRGLFAGRLARVGPPSQATVALQLAAVVIETEPGLSSSRQPVPMHWYRAGRPTLLSQTAG